MMPELNDAQIRLLAMDHAVKIDRSGDADELVKQARIIEAYLRGPLPASDSVQ